MTAVQATIPFKCQKPRSVLGTSTKQNIQDDNFLTTKSIMKNCRRSPRKRLGLGPDPCGEDLMTNEAVLDAIFKLSPHSPIKRYREAAKKSSLVTSTSSNSPRKMILTSPTRGLLSPIRALSLNSPPSKENCSLDENTDKKRAQILQKKLAREQETPTKPRGIGKKLNLGERLDETTLKVTSPEICKRVTRSAKKKAPKNQLSEEIYDDYKENEDPHANKELTLSPTKKARVALTESLNNNLKTPKSKRNNLKPFNTEIKKSKSVEKKSVTFDLNVKTDLATPKVKRNILKPSKSLPSLQVDENVEPKSSRSKHYLKLCKQNCEIYQKTKHAFHTSAPKELIGREKEISLISKHISTAIKKNSSGSLYISGAPGTGKSACLNKILAEQKVTKSSLIININCMSCTNAVGIYSKVATELGASRKECRNGRTARKYCEEALTSDGPTVILLLDEMDQLDSKNQEILYTMFEWPALADSRVMLIGIANSLDLTDRILPRLQLKVECKPTLINFQPYSKDQIARIIEDRISMANKESEDTRVIDKAAVQFCARKVAAVAGDARKALDICRRAIEVVESNTSSQLFFSPVKAAVPSKVGLPQIASVLNGVYEPSISSKSEDEGGLPLQQKLAICTLILLTRSLKCKVVTLGKFHESYMRICKKRQVTGVGQSEFLSILQLIESRGIVSIKSSKQIRQTKVNLSLQDKDVEYALQDKTLLTDILNQELPC